MKTALLYSNGDKFSPLLIMSDLSDINLSKLIVLVKQNLSIKNWRIKKNHFIFFI